MIMDSNESPKMSSNSTIDIVQSLMQEAFEAPYDETMEFLNDNAASKVADKDIDSSRSEFERLLSEGVPNEPGNLVDDLSNETVTFLEKSTRESNKGSNHISSKGDERMKDVTSPDDSEDLILTLDNSNTSIEALDKSNVSIEVLDKSNTSIEATKEDGEDTPTSESKQNKQSSAQTTKEQLKNDSLERKVSKEMPNGMIQIASVVSQTSIDVTQSSKTTEKYRNGSAADTVSTDTSHIVTRDTADTVATDTADNTVTTDSLEMMLESLDGPAVPQDIESDGNMNSNRQDSLLRNRLLMLSAGEGTTSPNVEDYSYQDVEIKIEVESEEEITYTETFCEGLVDRDNDTHYFKMYECKGLTIDLHDIIKTESSRDAKAGLYKPVERKNVDAIRKEYKTKAMQDYIRKAKMMRLPNENHNKRSSAYTNRNIPAVNRNNAAPSFRNENILAPTFTPMVSINLANTKKANAKSYTPKTKNNASTKKNSFAKTYKIDLSSTNNSYTKTYTPKSKTPISKTPISKTPISKKTISKTPISKMPKAPKYNSLKSQTSSAKKKPPPKSSKKLPIQKKAPQKMKVKFSFQKKNRQDYIDDDSNYDVDDDDSDDDEDYEPSKKVTNYVCYDCREYFETQAELNIHKRMEHNESSKYASWNTTGKAGPKKKRAKISTKKREPKPVYVKSDPRKNRGTLPVYFRSDQYRIDGINGMRKVRSFKPSQRNETLNKEDMIKGANLVYNHNPFYNYELGKNITDLEMYRHMMNKYTIKAAKLSIGTNKFSSFYQLAKSPTDSLRAKITTVKEERGHVLITSPLLHW